MGRSACKDFPNFKFDPQKQQNKPPITTTTANTTDVQQRTANIQKYSSLGRRPLPQTPDEKMRKQPPIMPKVPNTNASIETPLNPANFRSLQRGAWQDATLSPIQTTNQQQTSANLQFRSLQRGASAQNQQQQQPSAGHHHHHHSQFRSVKIQDQAQDSGMYANNESERQLYAVTEL